MIRQDSLTIMLTAIASAIAVYLSTWIKVVDPIYSLFLIGLMGLSLTLSLYMQKKVETDPNIDEREGRNIIYYTLIGLVGILIGAYFNENLRNPAKDLAIGLFEAKLFGVLMAIVETQFFHAFWINFFDSRKIPPMLNTVLIGGFGVIYHLARYGLENIYFVFIAFTILAWVNIKTRRATPAMLAHIINNLMW